jgi:hypothetical protein
MLLAYLPQHDWEVMAVTLSVCFCGLGFILLLSGRAPGGERMSPHIIRTIGGFQILLGVGVGLAGFFTNSEPPSGLGRGGHWGDSTDIAALGVWLVGLAAILVSILRKYRH